MPRVASLVQFPVPSTTTLVLLALLFAGVLIGALTIESRRRRRVARRRAESEWKAVQTVFRERDLNDTQVTLLRNGLLRHEQNGPLHAVTTREGFGHCVDRAMAAQLKKKDAEAYAQLGAELRDIRSELGLDYVPLGQRIGSTRELHAGQWMFLAKASNAKPHWCRVMVEVVDEAYFHVSARDTGDDPLPSLGASEKVRCRLWRDEDARYLFTTTVAARDRGLGWILRHTKDLERTQARAHFRVHHDQTTMVGVLSASIDDDETGLHRRRPVTRLRGRITSLSAGGCAMVLHQSVAKQVLLRLQIDLDGTIVDVEAKIIATSPISGGRYHVRTKFVGLDQLTRDALSKYVVHRQQLQIAEHASAR